MADKTVSLVLGSGGARGLAHIGVINWLSEQGYDIHSISGTSIGALIGGIYATGNLDVYSNWVTRLERIDVIRLLDFSFGNGGLIKGERIIGVLRELIGQQQIEDLPISYTAIATDLDNQKEVWLNTGPVFDAIRASIAIPSIFTPVNYHGKRLVDGGLINPIPIAPTLQDKTDITIAVNLSAPPCYRPIVTRSTVMSYNDKNHYRQIIRDFVDELQHKVLKDYRNEMGLFEIITHSLDTMQNTIAHFKLAAYAPDLIINIPRNACTFYEFHRAKELIDIGRHQAEVACNNLH